MKNRLLDLLVCPACGQPLSVEEYSRAHDEIVEGLLSCPCGQRYPIVDAVPRVFADAFAQFPAFARAHADRLPPGTEAAAEVPDAIRETRASFGYQWTEFAAMVIDFRQNFLDYIHPVEPPFFPGKLGLDVGCGFGRHIYNAAQFGAEMVGLDLSAAIDSTRRNTKNLPNVHLVQADIYRAPFRPGTFDFAYSIGVLHHLPDPEGGFRSVVSLVRPKGSVFVWVYSKSRRIINALLEAARAVTTRLPAPIQKAVSWAAAVVDWGLFVLPYRTLARVPGVGTLVRRLPLPRLQLYAAYPFQVVWADWFDRLAAPIRFYYNDEDLAGWLSRSQLGHTTISPTGLFGWRAYGERG